LKGENTMTNINQLAMMRKLLGITQEDVANEMDTTKQTISNIESGKAENPMAFKFYRLTVPKLIAKIDKDTKENLVYDLEDIIRYLKESN
jgi:DNA-binding XRE family transcriptional regulator